MDQLNKTARLAGFLYLLVALTGPFVLLYVPGKLFVLDNAAATAANILTHESLFRSYIVVSILSELFFIATVLALYLLFKAVNRRMAIGMVLLVLVHAPVSLVGIVNDMATLSFVKGGTLFAPFDQAQRDALATWLLNVNARSVLLSEVFWGLWLFPLAALVYRSGFLPRFLAVWLALNGLAYVVTAFGGILFPEALPTINAIALPLLFGELALTLWLLVVGVKTKAPAGFVAGTA